MVCRLFSCFLADWRSSISSSPAFGRSVCAFEKLHKLKTISLHLQGFTCLHRRLRSVATRFVVASRRQHCVIYMSRAKTKAFGCTQRNIPPNIKHYYSVVAYCFYYLYKFSPLYKITTISREDHFHNFHFDLKYPNYEYLLLCGINLANYSFVALGNESGPRVSGFLFCECAALAIAADDYVTSNLGSVSCALKCTCPACDSVWSAFDVASRAAFYSGTPEPKKKETRSKSNPSERAKALGHSAARKFIHMLIWLNANTQNMDTCRAF